MAQNRRSRRRRTTRRAPRKGRLQNARKMTGDSPVTAVDRIARGVGSVATIAKTVSGIVSMINVEDKYVDTALSASITSVSHYAVALNAIAQGADVNQRNGNKVLDKYIQLNLRLFLDSTASATQTNTLRLVVVIDKKPQIGALTWNTVYVPNDDVAAFIDKDTAGDRIVILKDYRTTFSGGERRLIYKKFYMSLARLHTQYTGSGSTAFETGALYLLAISDVTGLSPAVHLVGNSRFAYMDN